MGFSVKDANGRGGFARIWKAEDKGRYSVVQLSTSKKNKETDEYETDYSDNFARFISTAHEKLASMTLPATIQITSGEVTRRYDGIKKKEYIGTLVYAFDEVDNSKPTQKKVVKKAKTEPDFEEIEADADLPF